MNILKPNHVIPAVSLSVTALLLILASVAAASDQPSLTPPKKTKGGPPVAELFSQCTSSSYPMVQRDYCVRNQSSCSGDCRTPTTAWPRKTCEFSLTSNCIKKPDIAHSALVDKVGCDTNLLGCKCAEGDVVQRTETMYVSDCQ